MNIIEKNNHLFCIAPMLNYTDKHCRYFYRQMTKKARLYTEMTTTNEILNNNKKKIIYNTFIENPIAIQLAGRIPRDLVKCAKIASIMGYNEINLNIGCPSIRVQVAQYGICLMKEISVIINCINAIYNSVSIPISIKTRIGVDNLNNYSFIRDFIGKVSQNGYCKIFIIHARIAWLLGVNPKKNRNIPQLKYNYVYKLKKDFPYLTIVINGGIKSTEEAQQHLPNVDGVMIGRAVYKNPSILTTVDKIFFDDKKKHFSIIDAIKKTLPYIEKEYFKNGFNKRILRHISGAFYNLPGSKIWKKKLSQLTIQHNIQEEILQTLKLIAIE